MRKILVVAAVVCVIFLLWVHRRIEARRQKAYETARFAALQPADLDNTIMVTLVGITDALVAAETIFALFNEARCPWALRVRLLHYVDDMDGHDLTGVLHQDIAAHYAQLCRSRSAHCFADFVHIERRSRSFDHGPGTMLRHVMQHMYGKERYILVLGVSSVPERNWDHALLQQYALCRARSPRAMLTTCPPELHDVTRLRAQAGPTYPQVTTMDTASGAPRLRAAPFVDSLRACMPTWFFSLRFSFADAAAWRVTDFDPPYELVPDADEFAIGAALWRDGWVLYTPMSVIFSVTPLQWTWPDTRPRESQRVQAVRRFRRTFDPDGSFATYMRLCGVDVASVRVFTFATLGWSCADPSRAERAVKDVI
jgi:hypothetical protein